MSADTTRISCAALCRIEIDGSFLLEINKNRGNVLTPIGGALEVMEQGRLFLVTLGAGFEKRSDLRLSLPTDMLGSFAEWFARRVDRETTPLRELSEELIEEHAVPLPSGLLADSEIRFLGCVPTEESSTRSGIGGSRTHYFFEIFQVNLPETICEAIRISMRKPESRLRTVTRCEIEGGKTRDGFPIANSAGSLLRTGP